MKPSYRWYNAIRTEDDKHAFKTGEQKMRRRQFLSGILAYNGFLLNARAQGTSRAPKLKISEVRAVSLRAGKSKFVPVYTDQGLTGTG